MNSDIILESTGPRLYSAVYHSYIPLPVREQPYPGELQARSTPTCVTRQCQGCPCARFSCVHVCQHSDEEMSHLHPS